MAFDVPEAPFGGFVRKLVVVGDLRDVGETVGACGILLHKCIVSDERDAQRREVHAVSRERALTARVIEELQFNRIERGDVRDFDVDDEPVLWRERLSVRELREVLHAPEGIEGLPDLFVPTSIARHELPILPSKESLAGNACPTMFVNVHPSSS